MIIYSLPDFWQLLVRGFALSAVLVVSGVAGAEVRPDMPMNSALVDYARSSLHLSLCAVVFEEELGDAQLAARYQNGSAMAERLIQESEWTSEEVLDAHNFVMERDFSFRLPRDESWNDFRKEYFSSEHCEEKLATVSKQKSK